MTVELNREEAILHMYLYLWTSWRAVSNRTRIKSTFVQQPVGLMKAFTLSWLQLYTCQRLAKNMSLLCVDMQTHFHFNFSPFLQLKWSFLEQNVCSGLRYVDLEGCVKNSYCLIITHFNNPLAVGCMENNLNQEGVYSALIFTHVSCCFPFERLCSLCHQTDSTEASWCRLLQPPLGLWISQTWLSARLISINLIYFVSLKANKAELEILSVVSLTWVYSNAYCKGLIGHVADFENFDGAEEM